MHRGHSALGRGVKGSVVICRFIIIHQHIIAVVHISCTACSSIIE